ncbi:carbohydrate ABC transporter substrate-binding protein [Actinobacteria bacterium YIM 96077]|uniref:Carbohydrate ABC transporter substrate-binding protein n=1 Tax=Phytoactinopolyspora halophila TaxID=1981511 RepID=A0A329QAF3_9ACTN|nr:ABC transporter substrate-binding protein [Phytoactinopolyspora halophila]AYY14633.1 carbohydrate ABC transporter substrate-binding protein [Actinobacteria bacterium YIM 96077]RAW09197.1 carbohydrate ABC transporter substrate-binding protein [Phytoactinopolyspora halophila]
MARSNARRSAVATGCVLGLSFFLASCGDDGGGDDSDNTDAAGDVDCSEFEQYTEEYGDLEGTEVTIYSTITPPEDEPHIESYVPFEECTGVDVVYEHSDEFEAQLQVRINGGNPPDIAYVPQPGLLETIVQDTGAPVPAPEGVEENVDEFFSEDWKEYGTIDGTFYAAPLGSNVKSFVWYSPTTFEANGYEVPETWDDLIALSDQIVDDGGVPWCQGIASGDATGWPATDFIEDILLRTAGPEVYDQWYQHEIPFNDPQVVDAVDQAGEILKNPDYVNGGFGDVSSIATTDVNQAGLPILEEQCYLHRAASFYAPNWPEDAEIAEDGDVYAFYLPAIEEEFGDPVLGAGEFTVAFDDRPEVQAFQEYVSSAEWANDKAELGGWVSANTGVELDNYQDPISRLSAELLQDDDAVFRFDASDLMPGDVGAGSFWTGMVDWITGAETEEVLTQIEETWPEE